MLITASSSYPFLSVLWDILIVFCWFLYIWLAIVSFTDLFRRRDISGWAKAAWIFLIVIIPWFGVLIYLIANHDGMAERNEKQAQAVHAQFDQAVRQAASTGGPASEIDTAKKLEGLVRGAGVHASAVVIAPQPLTELVPLNRTKNDEIVTAYDMKAVEKMGLLKMDFLGLATLTVITD